MDKALLIQLVGSATAVALLVGLAAWARIARPTPPLDGQAARTLLADEFPDDPVDALWTAADGTGAVARSGDLALVLWRKGDGYVARAVPWAQARAATVEGGRLKLRLADASPRLSVSDGAAWPPPELAPNELAA
ncbi:hypothetical protein ASD79_18975 [Caulobacter sp. Root655]|uniref:hypothetical protein n=1 Tax=Caulobacter sp. Root655 TaxID=1736578 RepID=UPI0006FD63BD|nr:hypothetical protein [Caulobacter sp. Root655]KRA65019.1 hypothetical protein ASD79_18975 [Caulobacter sp. Root655]